MIDVSADRLLPVPRNFLLDAGPSFIAIAGVIANIIQIVTVGRVTTEGLVAFGFVVTATVVLVGYNFKRRRKVDDAAVGELNVVRSALASTFAAYRPYQDELTIVFNIGEGSTGDVVEEHHVTTALQDDSAVHWCHLEPVTRGPSQSLEWNLLKLLVNRRAISSGQAQRAVPIRLHGTSAPVLIFFAPPSATVEWMANYRSPSFWDPLRRDYSQQFEWIPPALGLDEMSKRRSPVRSITFEFRVPPSLGMLADPGPPPKGVTFRRDSTGVHEYTIHNVAELPGGEGSTVNPISWPLRLIRREGET
ncbi:hypothetical protein [Actinoplanes regularis]|uniref:Uncharacterized protein n=1 Tax=Actinoplanes regularis TaxID=52697 RepID=A0A239ENI2_9ACTN|nr:hypothetical protein [Actinoplanes regularis]GIE89858.1 hypothetical protein Are01nite_63380 [Actinoplanes regularis]SNS46310.1 hypothetical protein SAMN06264365_11634 [Actinoplanes regularis]